ncbi:MAG: gliding motility lipoprotein GldH [Muribaculaceae bacterium]|nr:gliding motility lipoprotein GldH [Muribaculaceae bacterium]
MRRLPAVIITTLVVLLASSCGKGERDYSRWAELPPSGWAYGDTLMLVPADTTLADNDSIVTRRLSLGVVHTSTYPYSNLWLEVTYHGDGHLYRDTVNMLLADVYGRWLGAGFGASYQREITLTPHADIDLTRPVAVRHIMRLDTLPAIERVGIEVD